jgi:hypothetical protein
VTSANNEKKNKNSEIKVNVLCLPGTGPQKKKPAKKSRQSTPTWSPNFLCENKNIFSVEKKKTIKVIANITNTINKGEVTIFTTQHSPSERDTHRNHHHHLKWHLTL